MIVEIDVSRVRPELEASIAVAWKGCCGVYTHHGEDIRFNSMILDSTSPRIHRVIKIRGDEDHERSSLVGNVFSSFLISLSALLFRALAHNSATICPYLIARVHIRFECMIYMAC